MTRRRPRLERALPIALLILALAAHAQVAVPTLSGRVVDRADVLDAATESSLTDVLASHEADTGNQVVVLTVSTLEGETVERVALRVFNEWGLGQEEQDNGVLVLIARDEREMRIEVGYGLEATLTDSRAGRIIRSEFVPAFRDGDYDAGTLAGVSAILATIEGTYEPPEETSGEEMPWFARLMFGLMFGALPLVAFAPTFFFAGRPGGLVFAGIFLTVGSGIFFFSLWAAALTPVVYAAVLLLGEWWFRQQPNWEATRAEVAKSLDENKGRRVKVEVGGRTLTVGGITQGSGGSSSGGFGSSGGGGFSGGGGSSGGGGASGSW
jgi:uncharacterized protein